MMYTIRLRVIFGRTCHLWIVNGLQPSIRLYTTSRQRPARKCSTPYCSNQCIRVSIFHLEHNARHDWTKGCKIFRIRCSARPIQMYCHVHSPDIESYLSMRKTGISFVECFHYSIIEISVFRFLNTHTAVKQPSPCSRFGWSCVSWYFLGSFAHLVQMPLQSL